MREIHWVLGGLLAIAVLAVAGCDLDFAVGWLNGVLLYRLRAGHGVDSMSRYEVEVEATYRAVVVVEARTRDEARRMAERGPDAWLDPAPVLEHVHTEPGETWRQDEAGEDEMSAWKARCEQ